MQYRQSKRSSTPPRPRSRTTRRGIAPIDPETHAEPTGLPPFHEEADDEAEPAVSMRPTRRDIVAPEPDPVTTTRARGARGEFSISSARGIAADVVAGSIERRKGETSPPRRRRTSMPHVEAVHLAHATKREITVIIHGETLTLSRQDALALAQIILTTFG